MIQIESNPRPRQLRTFGVLLPLFFILVGGVLWLRFSWPTAAYGAWGVGALLTLAYLSAPSWRRAIYVGWMYSFFPLGWVLSHLVLVLVYYFVVTPTGLLMRLIGWDSLTRRPDSTLESYWTERRRSSDIVNYFRQF